MKEKKDKELVDNQRLAEEKARPEKDRKLRQEEKNAKAVKKRKKEEEEEAERQAEEN